MVDLTIQHTPEELKAQLKAVETEIAGLKIQLIEKESLVEEINKLLKPFVAVVYSYSGGGCMAFSSLDAATKKYHEYRSKKYFRNGLNYGVFLFEYVVVDGVIRRKLIHHKALAPRSFRLPEDLAEQVID
ncbi:hypothetical protein [Exiguobacterium sp. CinTr1]|uniref:hypothetical protein n=1 Tax=Exiguobacterium sp. CinTr1 TaxID=2995315 RepID=UPI0022E5E467|nr:hypothetical protein [Exiguobacterium sp. CinTr1]